MLSMQSCRKIKGWWIRIIRKNDNMGASIPCKSHIFLIPFVKVRKRKFHRDLSS